MMVKKLWGLLVPCSFTLCSRSTGFLSLSSFTCSRQYGTSCHGLNPSTCCLSICKLTVLMLDHISLVSHAAVLLFYFR